MGIEKSVGAIVVNQDGEYLLLCRADKENEYWEFPKGHQHANESDLETMKRELAEECNITDFEIVWGFVEENKYTSSSSGNIRVILLYLVKVRSSEIQLSGEHRKYMWFDFDGALAKLNHETWKTILISANSLIRRAK